MRSARVKVITPVGEFYSQSADVSDDVTGEIDEEFYQTICKDGSYYQMTLEDGLSCLFMPKGMIQESIFIFEVRQKGEEEVDKG